MESESIGRIKARRPVAAVILSVLHPGLGQIYCGQFGRGMALFAVALCLETMGMFMFALMGSALVILPLVSFATYQVLMLYSAVSAGIKAGRIGADYRLRDYNRWWFYLLLMLLTVPLAIGAALTVRTHMVQAFYSDGDAMQPTIRQGDRVLVSKRVYRDAPPRRGDVIAHVYANDRSSRRLKRIIALAGDTVGIRAGQVYVNDRPLAQARVDAEGNVYVEANNGVTYRILLPPPPTTQPAEAANHPSVTVPVGHCYVLNDNRAHDDDSRSYGPVPLTDVIGRVEWTYWPRRRSLRPQKE